VIAVRRARALDAAAIAAVHVAAWRSAYAGILPDDYLARLSVPRQAAYYLRAIESGIGVHVVAVSGNDLGPDGGNPRIVGFSTARRLPAPGPYAEGEIETLYVLDDWRERGFGRQLMRASAAWLARAGCASVFLWVLRDNPSRWFYERLDGKPVAHQAITVAGQPTVQTAYVWSSIDRLVSMAPPAA
jgi:ribosomal protein S18 acetylase RimI-like enzyme